jgi:hypothetical protein
MKYYDSNINFINCRDRFGNSAILYAIEDIEKCDRIQQLTKKECIRILFYCGAKIPKYGCNEKSLNLLQKLKKETKYRKQFKMKKKNDMMISIEKFDNMENFYRNTIRNINNDHDIDINKCENYYERKIVNITNDYELKLQNMTNIHNSLINGMVQECEKQKCMLINSYENRINNMKDGYEHNLTKILSNSKKRAISDCSDILLDCMQKSKKKKESNE